jgi:methionyl-tRNA formyltransferase
LRLIFAGTPEFAAKALERLLAAGHTIALVLTQPDRPAGRGMKLQASAVKQLALAHQIPVTQPRSLRLDGKYPEDATAALQAIQDAQPDAMVVAAYGLILPQWVLDAMRERPGQLGCLNIHASLLPRWRGAAPIHRAIEAGDRQTGVTIMQMDAGLDTGDMLLVQALDIAADDTTATLHDRLADLGGEMIVRALGLATTGQLHPQPQPAEGITYAHKIEKQEAAIDWSQSAEAIVQKVRAFNPFPGASVELGGEVLKIWAASVGHAADWDVDAQSLPEPGFIMGVARVGIAVAAIKSIVVATQLQRPGGKRLAASDYVRGHALQVGMRFGAPT